MTNCQQLQNFINKTIAFQEEKSDENEAGEAVDKEDDAEEKDEEQEVDEQIAELQVHYH